MNENIIRASLVVGGAAVGGGAGYFLAKKHLRDYYQAQAEEQVAQVKEHYDRRYKEGAFATPAGAVEALVVAEDEPVKAKPNPRAIVEDILGREGYVGQAKVEVTDDGLTVEVEKPDNASNIFTKSPTELDLDEDGVPWDLGLPERQSDEPYIIHVDEFMSSTYDQVTLTYFVADDTLVDEREHMVDDIDGLVGQNHLGMFGRGSKDDNIVYIRNEVIMTDFEVIQSESSYAEAVLGMREDELEEPAPRKKKPKKDERDD